MPSQPSLGLLSTLAGTIRQHPRYAGCLAHWPLVEGLGTAAFDLSGYKNHGVLTTGATWNVWPGGIGGEFPVGGHVVLTNTLSEWSGNINTLSFWMRFDAYDAGGGSSAVVFSTDTGGLNFWGPQNAGADFQISGALLVSYNHAAWIGDQTWRHIVCRCLGTSGADLYVNGVFAASVAGTAQTVPAGAKTHHLGKYTGSTTQYRFDGGLAEFRIYNRALTPAEIASLYTDPFLEIREAVARLDEVANAPSGGLTHVTLTAELGTYGVTGQTANLLQGSKVAANQGSYALAGQTANLLQGYKVAAQQGAYALAGQAVTLLQGYKVAANQGAYALSGQIVSLEQGYTVAAVQGSYVLTGQASQFSYSQRLAAALGSYALTGQAVTLSLSSRSIVAGLGTYSLSGQAVGFLYSQRVVAAQGAYTLSGQAVLLNKGRSLLAALGSYALSGQAVQLLHKQILVAAAGAYALSGQPVLFRKGRTLTAALGSYLLSGQAVQLLHSQRVSAALGNYGLSGQAVALLKKRTLIVGPGTYTLTGQSVLFSRTKAVATTTGVYVLSGQAISFQTSAVFPRFGAISSALMAMTEGVVLGRLGGVIGFFSLKALGVHVSTTASYSSTTGTSGTANTAMTVLSRTLRDNALSTIGDRLRVRCHFKAATTSPIVLTLRLGPAGSEQTIAAITYANGTAGGMLETHVDYIDATHAMITEEEAGVVGATWVLNQAGFLWTSMAQVLVTQNAVAGNFVTVHGLYVDVLPLGVF